MLCFGHEVSLPLDVATPPCLDEMELTVPDLVLKTQVSSGKAETWLYDLLLSAFIQSERCGVVFLSSEQER